VWTRDYVVPYLEERYPDEVAALLGWVEEHGGLRMSLGMLAGDPRTTQGQDGERLFFSVNWAFESLFEAVLQGGRPPETHIEYARDLHYGRNHDEALAILARVLQDHPGETAAMTLRADIFVHQGRLDECQGWPD
jgi:hypothetical protein